MKKTVVTVLGIMLGTVLALSFGSCSGSGGKYKPGTYTGTGKGHNGDVTVTVTLTKDKIKSVAITEQHETAGLADPALKELPVAVLKAQSADVDTVSGCTDTSKGILSAIKVALSKAGATVTAEAPPVNVPVTYKAGTYSGSGTGMNGPVVLDVTFSNNAITDIKVNSSKETPHVGTPAFDIMFADAIAANGSGIDTVSGATFTSNGVRNALVDAAQEAGASDIEGFKTNRIVHTAEAPIEGTYDVVVVGGGGAGIAAGAQAAQNGDSVLIIEKNAEIGGNTLVSGGQFQSVMPYLVWDPANPDATAGVYTVDGKTYNKVKEANGNITVLKTILNWDEKKFDGTGASKWFVAGDIAELSKHGVHAEYLPTLQALKGEIKAYLAWAEPKLAAGVPESELTLFSTINLHIFQTYYGGLRPNAEFTEWVYGNYDLVSQFIKGGQDLKPWLEAQGSTFVEDIQPTIVGALWNRENQYIGANFDADGDGKNETGQWGSYFVPPRRTILETSKTAASNKIMLRTAAKELIVEKGRVTGVKAVMFDGTQVTAHAKKGVVLATGGYAANIAKVVKTNDYWKAGTLSDQTKTTNRSSLVGDGLDMGEKAGAAMTGLEFTQLMPISWVDNGQLAFGGGNYAIYLNPVTGKRYLNETGERDVLSLGEFENGIEHNGVKGTVIEISNDEQAVPGPYPYGRPGTPLWDQDVEWRQYTRTIGQLGDLFTQLDIKADPAVVRKEITDYDHALMTGTENKLAVPKTGWTALIGNAGKNKNGSYNVASYKLDGVKLKIRLLAPSTHHTMGGLTVDTERHVLTQKGKIIKGLYAAGEVTGGIHGGNRLGGNAIVEVFVSGRTAANAIDKDN